MSDDCDPLEKILTRFAAQLADAPGAARLKRLAKTAKNIPERLLIELTGLVTQLDVGLVGDDVWFHLVEIAYCDVRVGSATEFVSALAKRLRTYIADPAEASAARSALREKVSWWKMAMRKAAELQRWPAIVLARTGS